METRLGHSPAQLLPLTAGSDSIGRMACTELVRRGAEQMRADEAVWHRFAIRRCILARVKFLSRLMTALNLLPLIATPASVKRPIVRHSTTNRLQTWRMARPLSLRKSARGSPILDELAHYAPERWVQRQVEETGRPVALRASSILMHLEAIRAGTGPRRTALLCRRRQSAPRTADLADPRNRGRILDHRPPHLRRTA
jgi:hypothetical protein